MSERFVEFHVERDGSKFNYITIDLESVVSFAQNNDLVTRVETAAGSRIFIEVTYAEFKKIHTAYHASKAIPTVLAPSVQIAPLTNEVPSVLTTTATPPKEWERISVDEGPAIRDLIAIDVLRGSGHAVLVVFPEDLKGVNPRKLEAALSLHVKDEIKALKE
jgi:hypothetical protein